jgi:hypothetical protein
VYAIVSYEGFVLDSDVEDACVDMIRHVVDRHYLEATRFMTSPFMRAKPADTL